MVARAWMRKSCRDITINVLSALQQAENSAVEIVLANMDDEEAKAAGVVWQELTLITRGEAGRIVAAAEDENGFEAWRLLARRSQGGGPTRAKTLMSLILGYSFETAKIMDQLAQWERLIAQYEKGPPPKKFDDDVKMSILLSNSQGDIRKKLRENLLRINDYEMAKKYVQELVDLNLTDGKGQKDRTRWTCRR